jgi:hypothetical protein
MGVVSLVAIFGNTGCPGGEKEPRRGLVSSFFAKCPETIILWDSRKLAPGFAIGPSGISLLDEILQICIGGVVLRGIGPAATPEKPSQTRA